MSSQKGQSSVTHVVNGVDVNYVENVISEIQKNPEIAKFKFRIDNKWCGRRGTTPQPWAVSTGHVRRTPTRQRTSYTGMSRSCARVRTERQTRSSTC